MQSSRKTKYITIAFASLINFVIVSNLIFSFSVWILITFFLFNFLIVWKTKSNHYFYSILVSVCFTLLFLIDGPINNKYHHQAKVVRTYDSSILVKEEGNKYLISVNDDVNQYEVDDKIKFSCYYESPNTDDEFGIFLKSVNANGSCFTNNEQLIEHGHSFRHNKVKALNQSDSLFAQFSSLLLFGNTNDSNQEFADQVTTLGLSHLFVISGNHVNLILYFLIVLLTKISTNKRLVFFISLGFMFMFIHIIGWQVSATRSFLLFAFIMINKLYFSERYSNIDLLSYSGFALIIFNPYLVFNTGFILSVIVSWFLTTYASDKSKIKISIISFIVAAPIVASFATTTNIFSPIYSFILAIPIDILYVISLVLMVFEFTWQYVDIVYTPIFAFTSLASQIDTSIQTPDIGFALTSLWITTNFLQIYKIKKDRYMFVSLIGTNILLIYNLNIWF